MNFPLRRKRPLPVRLGFLSDPGCERQGNEDSGCAVAGKRGALVVVADGMGGHEAGEVASRLAVETVERRYFEGAPLESALRDANCAVFETASRTPEFHGMGTTCTALALRGGSAWSGHVGDSRMYLVRNGGIYQMTEDHTAVMDMVKQGLLTRIEAKRHADRNVLVRALGTRGEVEVSVWKEPVAILPGDAFVLCSDGLHDLVGEDEIRDAAAGEPQAACQSLVALAKSRGGYDNITVAIAKVEGGDR